MAQNGVGNGSRWSNVVFENEASSHSNNKRLKLMHYVCWDTVSEGVLSAQLPEKGFMSFLRFKCFIEKLPLSQKLS